MSRSLKKKSTFGKGSGTYNQSTTRITHAKELALEECVRNFKVIHKNIDILDFFQNAKYEPYLARLKDMSLYMQEQKNICLETALTDIAGIIVRILQFAEKHQLLQEITRDCHWNPLIFRALDLLIGESLLLDYYKEIHSKI
ncbi:MAG: hypothetical protein R3A13_10220 [Bdellovibrionota bacterium]